MVTVCLVFTTKFIREDLNGIIIKLKRFRKTSKNVFWSLHSRTLYLVFTVW